MTGLAWPTMFGALLKQYGPARVWRAGLVALGYPPTWANRFGELEAVRVRLNTCGD